MRNYSKWEIQRSRRGRGVGEKEDDGYTASWG